MDQTTETSRTTVNRRDVLKMVGGGAVGIAAMTGTASAWQFQFYGCSQVCSDSRGSRAVVAVDGGYECREMTGYNSDRQNQDWKWSSACYEVSDGESIVGIVESCSDDKPKFCVNPNNCASNYYDSVDDILADLKRDGCCSGKTIVEGDCDVSGTGRGNDGKRGRGNAADEERGRGNDHRRNRRGRRND